MMSFSDVEKALRDHCMVWADGVDALPDGKIRLETKFKYPDGGSIELYLVEDAQTPRLTDLGETMTWLFHAQVKPWASAKRRTFVEDVLEQHGVTQRGGELLVLVPTIDKLGESLIALGQSCLRISDLIFTKRFSISSPLSDQVESALDDAEFSYEPDVEVEGRFGNKVRLDFLVKGRHRPSGILTLSSTTRSSAHTTANELFSRWYDVEGSTSIDRRLTVFDDSHDWYRSEDLERLEKVSAVVPVSDTKMLVELLEAA